MNKCSVMIIKNKKVLRENFGKENEEELDKEKLLAKKLLMFYNKVYDEDVKDLNYGMFDYDFYSLGYNTNYGYYVVEYYHSNSYLVISYGENIDDAFFFVANRIIDKKRMEYASQNKKSIDKEYKKRFKEMKYHDVLIKAEYDLNVWNKYFDGNIPGDIITQYVNYVNIDAESIRTNVNFIYDHDNQKFVFDVKPKVRSLKK